MSSSLTGIAVGNVRGDTPRHVWGQRYLDPVIGTLGGEEPIQILRGGALVTVPRREACVVFRDMTGYKGNMRGTFVGIFGASEAWQETCCVCPAKDTPVLKCICSRRDGRPFFNDSITLLGDLNWTKSDHLLLARQLARDWLGGSASMEDRHVHTHHYSVIQCLIFRAQEASALLSAIVPIWRSFCKGHLVFEDWAKITIQMTHDVLLNDQTQKMMAHAMTQWLATVRPALFASRPLVQMNRLLWMRMLATTLRRTINKGNKDVSKNQGLLGIYLLVPGLLPFAETCHTPLDPGQVERFKSSYVADRAALMAAFAAMKDPLGPVGSLIVLSEHLRTGAPLTKVQAGQLMGFCTSNKDQSKFPDWEAMGIIAPSAKTALELSVGRGPFKMTTFKAILKTLESDFEPHPTDENAGFIKSAKSHEWAGIQLPLEGTGVLTPDYAGVAAAGTPGAIGELGVGNWRLTYGTAEAADVMDPTCFGFSSLGVFCDPRITGPSKWIKTGNVPGCDHPIHYSFIRPNLIVTINGHSVLNVSLKDTQYPVLSFKSVYFRLKFTPKPAPVTVVLVAAAAVPVPTKSISWLEAAGDGGEARGGAGGPPPSLPPPPPPTGIMRSNTVCMVEESKVDTKDPLVTSMIKQIKSNGLDQVMAQLLNATMPTGALNEFEKELATALKDVGKKGVTEALKEAQKLA